MGKIEERSSMHHFLVLRRNCDNKLAIIVFDFAAPDSIERVVSGDTSCGTIVS